MDIAEIGLKWYFINPCLQTIFFRNSICFNNQGTILPINKPETLAGTVPYGGMSTVQCMSIYLHSLITCNMHIFWSTNCYANNNWFLKSWGRILFRHGQVHERPTVTYSWIVGLVHGHPKINFTSMFYDCSHLINSLSWHKLQNNKVHKIYCQASFQHQYKYMQQNYMLQKSH